jgi:hypothetical protein
MKKFKVALVIIGMATIAADLYHMTVMHLEMNKGLLSFVGSLGAPVVLFLSLLICTVNQIDTILMAKVGK